MEQDIALHCLRCKYPAVCWVEAHGNPKRAGHRDISGMATTAKPVKGGDMTI